jgi:hypothetical protein
LPIGSGPNRSCGPRAVPNAAYSNLCLASAVRQCSSAPLVGAPPGRRSGHRPRNAGFNPYRPEVGADWGVGEPGGSEVTSGCCGFFAQPRDTTSMDMTNMRLACRLLRAVDGDMVVVGTVDLFLDGRESPAKRTTPIVRRLRSPQCSNKANISAVSVGREQVAQVSSLRSQRPSGGAILVLRPSSQNKRH